MDKLQIKTYKNHWGWNSESRIKLEGDKFLKIHTMKRHSGKILVIAQTMHKLSEDENCEVLQHGSFSKVLKVAENNRATKNNVKNTHIEALGILEDIKEELMQEIESGNKTKSFLGSVL